MPHRFLAIFFPFLSAESVSYERKELLNKPIIISSLKDKLCTVCGVNKLAANLGIYPNMPLSDALNIQKKCFIIKETDIDENCVNSLIIKELRKFSPWVSQKNDTSMIINITGCSHLFGGEILMIKSISLKLKTMGISCTIGIGNSPSTAIAAAIFGKKHQSLKKNNNNILSGNYINHEARTTRYNSKIRVNMTKNTDTYFNYRILNEDSKNYISGLPINLLDLNNQELIDLYFLGIKKISHLSKLKKYGIIEYFGKELINKLNTVLGLRGEPISPLREEYNPVYCKEFLYSINSINRLTLEITKIMKVVINRVVEDNSLLKEIEITFFDSTTKKNQIKLEFKNSTKELDLIISLIEIKTSDIQFSSGIKKIILKIIKTERNDPLQGDMRCLSNNPSNQKNINQSEAYAKSVSKISARIGKNNIKKIYSQNTHIPEKTTSLYSINTKKNDSSWKRSPSILRPIYLFSPKRIEAEGIKKNCFPEVFIWGGVKRRVSVALGPEVVAPEWWCQNSIWETHTRNYWIVELNQGEKLWVFELKSKNFSNQWYIHGNFC